MHVTIEKVFHIVEKYLLRFHIQHFWFILLLYQHYEPSTHSAFRTARLPSFTDDSVKLLTMPENTAARSLCRCPKDVYKRQVIGAAIVQAVQCRAVELMLADGEKPEVLISANVPGGDEHNRPIIEKYRKIVPFA